MNNLFATLKYSQTGLILLVTLMCISSIYSLVEASKTTRPEMKIGQGVQYIKDSAQALNIGDFLQNSVVGWQEEESALLSFGMSDSPYWLRFQLPVLDDRDNWVLEIDYALLDMVDVWFIDQDSVIQEYHQGDSLPFAMREIKHEKFLFPVPLVKRPITVIVKAKSNGTIKLPIRLWQEQTFMVFNGEHSIVMGLFFGFMLAMGLSNLFFYITTRAVTFLVYSAYVLSLALTLATLHGLGYKYLWPNVVWVQANGIAFFANATIFFAIVFTNQLLNIRTHSIRVSRVLDITAGVFLFNFVVCSFIPYAIFIKIFLVMLSVVVIFVYGVGIWLWFKGVRLARFYTIAWTALLVSGFVASLDNLNIMKLGVESHYLLMLGGAVETFLLALILALSYSNQRQELFEAQENALSKERQARNAQEKMIELQNETRDDLEYRVQERTLELEIALRELSETNRELEEKNTLDSLTGIRNRHYFDKKYLAEVRRSRREQTELSIVMLDIDHFKTVNDTYGHLAGDECIVSIASMLQKHLKRPSDDACRFGGEEFALILPNTDLQGAVQLVETLRKDIEKTPVLTAAGKISMTLSAGVSTSIIQPDQAENSLLDIADQCLYEAKNTGRNRVCSRFLMADEAANQ